MPLLVVPSLCVPLCISSFISQRCGLARLYCTFWTTGHSATLISDGLCSVGPLMERGSGSYHAELLVKQATDADGAYVGIVTPLAKLSSYPGADAHSVGWRAKGGLRHKHGSTVEAASLAWGQGDRVGLRLDTDFCSLSLYKNGEVLTTNQLLPVSFGEAGARFCIGRYYGTVEMYCVSLSRIGGSQSIDFSALSSLCRRVLPGESLCVLRLGANQLAGVDAVGGGERKETGVRELLRALESGPCVLDELNLGGNMLSMDDAQALVRAGMEPPPPPPAEMATAGPNAAAPRYTVRYMRINRWNVPSELLSTGCGSVLDLSCQDIAPPDALLLASTLRSQPTLFPTGLDLSANTLGADGAVTIVRALIDRQVPLRSMKLSRTGLLAQGTATLLSLFKQLPTLELLDLSSNAITVKEFGGGGGDCGGAGGGRCGGGSRKSGGGECVSSNLVVEGGAVVVDPLSEELNGRRLALDALEALGELLACPNLSLRTIRLTNCQLCNSASTNLTSSVAAREPPHQHAQQADKASAAKGSSRADARGIAALAAALCRCRCPLEQLTLGANRIGDLEAAVLAETLQEWHVPQLLHAGSFSKPCDDAAAVPNPPPPSLSLCIAPLRMRLTLGLEYNLISEEAICAMQKDLAPHGYAVVACVQQPGSEAQSIG